MGAGDNHTALEFLARVVDEYPSSRYSGIALYWLGRTQYQMGNDSTAAFTLDRYTRLAAELPHREDALLLLANSRYGLRAYGDALEAVLRVGQASSGRVSDFVDLSYDLLNHLPRATVESTAVLEPPRNFLSPFYVQASRWRYTSGDSAGAARMAQKVTEFSGLPGSLIAEATSLAGIGTGRSMLLPRLGFIAPSEGRFATVADEIRRGIELALEDVNRVREPDIQLIDRTTDVGSDSTIDVVRELARSERVEAVVGPLTSEFALPAGRVAAEEGVALVSPTATDARVLEIHPSVYTVNALDGGIGHTLGNYVVRSLNRRRVSILAVDDAYGRIQADAFEAAVRAAGGEVVARRVFDRGATQFTEDFGVIVRARAEAVFIATKSSTEALQILNQMAFYELQGLLPLGTDAWNDPSFFEQGGRFVRGYYADTFSRDPRVTMWEAFVARYESRFGETPGNLIPAWGYDAARLALERFSPHASGTESRNGEVRVFRGASGLFRFFPDGTRRAVVVHRIEDGEGIPVDW